MIEDQRVQRSLKQLLALDAKFALASPGAEGLFGDGYLLRHGKYYRNIRRSLLQRGYRLTSKDTTFYAIQPLLSLDQILVSKRIPYFRNAEGMRFVLNRRPQMTSEFISCFKRNYVVHEGAHCLAYSILPPNLRDVFVNQDICGLLLQETYASVCEIFCALEAESETHEIFIRQNTYDLLSPKELLELRRAHELMGSWELFKFLMCAYFYSNSLYLEVDDEDLKVILEKICLLEPSKRQFLFFKKVFHNSLNLSPEFSVTTASLYLKYLGVKKSLEELTRKDPLRFLQSDASKGYMETLFNFLDKGG